MEIKTGSTVSLEEFGLAIQLCGKVNTICGRGEPGVGKSSVLAMLTSKLYNPDAPLADTHIPCYIDCADKELGDLTIPYPDKEEGCTRYLPNEIFNIHKGKPLLIMLDEIGKAPQPVRNMLLPMETERRLGNMPLHPESIVFSTSNLTSDGVGDMMKAHEQNRKTEVIVRKSTAPEWLGWAMQRNGIVHRYNQMLSNTVTEATLYDTSRIPGFNVNNVKVPISEELMAWVKEYPHCMASYLDGGQDKNPYIFHPNKPQKAFFTPRSAEKASNILNNRQRLGPDLTIAMLIGTIGESAARDLSAFVSVADKLEPYSEIILNPKSVKVPNDSVAIIIQVYQFLSRVSKGELSDLMDYIVRIPKEFQAVFGTQLTMIKAKKTWVLQNQKFVTWARLNSYLFE